MTYHFKARVRDDRLGHIGSFCDQGGDTSITVYVSPTPVLSVSVPDTIVCDSTNLIIMVNDLNGLVHSSVTKVYQLTTTDAGGAVQGVQPSGEYLAGADITDQLINLTNQVQAVKYHFKARIRDDRAGHIGSFCDQGGDTSITVYVNPTAILSVSVPDTIVCDSSTVTITVNDLNGLVHNSMTKVYQLTATNPGGVLNVQSSGEYLAGADITDQLINLTNQVQAVTYHFKARIRDDRLGHIGSFCDQGGDTSITVYVSPTPVLSVSVPDTIVCDSTNLIITVNDLNGLVHSSVTKVYQLTTTDAGGAVQGVQPSGEYLAGADITDQLINLTNQVQAVTYHFKARIRDDRAGHIGSFCDQGGDTSITVYVSPTPVLSVSVPDTIVCDSSTVTITVNDLNGLVHSSMTKVYQLTTTNSGGVLNVQASGEYTAGTDIIDQLINPTSAVQTVAYHFKARVRDDRLGHIGSFCDQGGDTTLTIYVNPTPVLSVSVPDTIVCDSVNLIITLNDLNGLVHGSTTKVYELTTTDAGGNVLGVQPTGEYLAGLDISNQLINLTNQVQTVTYHFKAKIRDDRAGHIGSYCDQGGDTSITVYVNPTAILSVSVPDTIVCDSSTITITVDDLNGVVHGSTTKVYQLTTTNPGGVLNVQASGEYTAGTDIIDQLINPTSAVQAVTYHFKARIRDDRAGHIGSFCDQGGDTTLTIYVNPTPRLSVSVPDTIVCDSVNLVITVDDLNGVVHGSTTKVYELTTTDAGGNVLGVQPTGEYLAGLDISNQLINLTNQVQAVTYHFKARIRDDRAGHIGSYCDQGGDTSITVYVNPTAILSVSVPDTIVCDSSTVTITVNDLNGLVHSSMTKVYQLTTTNPGGVLNVQSSGEYLAGADITDQLINLTNQVQAVTYHFKARIRDDRAGHIGSFCDQGGDTTLTIYVNPTPRLSVSVPDTIVCDSTNLIITVNDLNGLVHSSVTKVYQLTTTDAGGAVQGVQPSGEYLAGADITDQLINLTNQVQAVTYHFKARIRDDRAGHIGSFCDQGGDTSITVYVNPTPVLSVSIPDTIYCDSNTININVNDLNGSTQGEKVYELTTTNAGGTVFGVQASGEYIAGTDISDKLINLSSKVQVVTYHFKARIRDDRSGTNFGYCDQGGDTIITVYVNPTPSLSVSIPDTIYCDSSTISITVNDLNGNTQGVKVYQLTTTDAGGNVLGVEASGEIAAGTDISNQLINLSNQIQAVTYHFKARIRDDRMSNNFGYCDQGGDTIITIYVNPTPVLSVSIPDTIYCDSSTINITVNDLNGSTQGAKVYELTTTNAGGTVLGVQASGEYIAGTDISDELINLSSEVQAVTYHFKARIRDDRSGTNFGYCDQGGDTIITVYVNPTPSLSVSIPDTIYCDSSTITITVNDLNGNTQGFKVYELTTTDAGGNVLGVEPSAEIAAGTDISNQLINLTSQVQAVTYHFKARIRDDRTGNNFGYCDQGGDTLLTIYVNPTPVLSVSVPDTIVCDSSTITITVNDLNGSTQGAKVYELTTTDAGGTVLGVQPTGEYTAGTDISDKLINTSSQVQAVTYHFKARIRDDRSGTNFGYCDQGGDTSLTVYVNPTPKLSVSVPDTIWCDSSTISITVNDLNGSTQGVKVYELTTTDAGGNVLGVQPSGEYTASTDISDQLINLTSEVQTVTYHFKARIRDDRTGNNFGYCDQGGDTLLTLYINPTPRLSVSIPDTIVCDSSTISITVNDLNGSTQGAKVYELTTTDAGGTVLGVQPTGEYTAGTDISDKLINTSSQVQAVTYHFKARIRDDRSGTNFGYCDQGGDTSLTVYVNPTPKLSVSVPDTIWCDSSTISITVNDLNGSTQGVKVYELTTTDAGGNVLGVQPSGEYTASTDISNQLINLTSEVQEVTYHFKARIRDDRTGHTGEYCDQGGDTLITLYINPTPRLSISIPDTIYCDSSTISITVNDLNGITQGVKVYQLTTTNAGGTVLGVQPTGEYNAGTDISDKLINLTSQVQEVTYQFKARIWDNRTGHASDYCDQGGDTLITIYVNPTPQLSVSVPDTIFCDSSLINISVNDLNGITQGVKVYQLTTTNAGGTVLGVQPTGEYNAGTDISNQLINLTSQVQTVTYHFKARIHDNRTGHESGYCSQGGDTLLTLYINPTPKLNVSIADTIYCDSTTISIRVDNLTGTTRGIKVYQLTSTNAGGNVLGVEPSGEFAAGADFSDKLINLTSQVQAVTYHFKARIRDDRTGHTSDYCDQGGDTLLTVYVNPTPRLSVSIPDTVYCDSSTINITINDLLGNTSGTKVYQVTTTDASGKVTGLQVNGEYPAGTDISNYLVNTTTSVQKVTYHFKARIKDERTGNSFDYCNQGGDTLLTIWINPTPRIRVSVPDTLYCNESDVRFKINNLNPSIIGQRAYNLTVTYDNSYISGVQPDGIYTMDMGAAFTNTLVNSHDSIYRKVTYHFMPQILDASTGFDCNVGIDTSISVYVAATLNSRILSRKYIGGHDIRCFGENNGALDLEVWGGFGETDLGLPGYTYSWKASPDGDGIVQGQQDQDNLTKGQYNVVITDAKSCLRYDTITLVEPEVLEIGWDTVTRNPCKSIGRAYIELQPAGGNEPYSYQWSGPNNFRLTTQNVYDLFQGFYTVVITDANGCRYFDKNGYIVVDADPIGLSIDNKMYGYYNVRCYGNTDGRLSIEGAQGGNGDYRDWKYHWTGPDYYEADTRTIENLAPGQYYLEIEDTSGCIHKIDEAQQRELEAVYIKEPPPISLDTVITSLYGGMYNISCNDSSDGFAEIAVDKDRLLRTYKYTWSTSTYTFPDTTSTRYNLPAGTYYVNILDNWGCPFSDTIILTEPPEINITPSFSDYNGYEVACFDGLNGRIAVQPTGGLQPYDYAWESVTTGTGYPSLNDSLITGLQAGTYRVTVTDSLNCAREWDFTLDQPEIIQVHPYPLFLNDDTLINVSCYGLSDASIDSIGTTGGIPDYSYFWTSESDTSWESPVENPTGMPAGIYVVTVTDQNGCTMETATTIKQPDPLSIDSVSIWNISCNASDDGSARIIEVSGGTPDYSFLWNDPAATTGPLVRNLPKGPVMVTVTDLNGCDTTQTVVIGEPDVLIVQLAPRVQYNGEVISCPDASDGSINARFSGGRPPYSYTWSPSGETGTTTSTMITLDGLPEDTYYIQVTDTAGCADDASLQIVDPVRMEIYPTLINITCHSYCDGSIEVAVAGGIRPLSYEWSNERTELGISGLCPGDYTVDITDQNSCHQDTTFTITEPEPLTITVDSVSPTCPDSYDGQISINVTGGTPKYEYSWSNGESNTTIIQNLGPDEYSVTVFDVNRCEIEREIVLLEDASSCIVIPTAITPNHDGYNDYWDIPGMHYYPRAVIEIFNRWGDLVYRSEGNYDIKFDGTYRGRELPMDSYHFVIDLKNGSDAIRGTITIIK